MAEITPNLTEKQIEAFNYLLDDTTNEVLFGGSAGGGKSYLGCAFTIAHCLNHKGIRCLIGRSKLDNLKKTTLNTFFEVCSQWKIEANKHYTYNAQSSVIKFFNGSEVYLKDLFQYPSDPNFDSLGSLELTFAFIDECNQISEKAKQIVNSRLRYKLDENNLIPKMLLTCNPTKNWVYHTFYKPGRENNLPKHRKFIQSFVDDNPHISKHYKEQLNKLDEISKQRLLFGNWEYDDSFDKLIEYDAIIDMFSGDLKELSDGDYYISCDVARFGKDKTVIMLWCGLNVKQVITMNTNTITQCAEQIKKLQIEHNINLNNIIVDDDGVGGGVKDILRCKGFVNNSKCLNNENYKNLKTQCYYVLAKRINDRLININCSNINVKNDIIQELEQVRRDSIDKDTKLSIISKDKIKQAIGRSPDYADAIMMRMFYEIDKNAGKYFVQ